MANSGCGCCVEPGAGSGLEEDFLDSASAALSSLELCWPKSGLMADAEVLDQLLGVPKLRSSAASTPSCCSSEK